MELPDYDWLLERLRNELPGIVEGYRFDYDTAYSIKYKHNGDRVSIDVEIYEYSLNRDPDKDRKVNEIIRKLKTVGDSL